MTGAVPAYPGYLTRMCCVYRYHLTLTLLLEQLGLKWCCCTCLSFVFTQCEARGAADVSQLKRTCGVCKQSVSVSAMFVLFLGALDAAIFCIWIRNDKRRLELKD